MTESNSKPVSKDLEDIGEAIFKIGTMLEGKSREEAVEIMKAVAKHYGYDIKEGQ